MISISSAVSVVVYLLVGGLVFWLLNWLIAYCGVPEPFNKIARVVLAIVAVLFVIAALMSLVNGTPIFRA